MAELLSWHHAGSGPRLAEFPGFRSLALYCWPCRTVHLLGLNDVERLIYALGFMLPVGEQQVNHGGENFPHPECHLHVLKLASDPDWYRTAVNAHVVSRADASPLPADQALDAERRGETLPDPEQCPHAGVRYQSNDGWHCCSCDALVKPRIAEGPGQ